MFDGLQERRRRRTPPKRTRLLGLIALGGVMGCGLFGFTGGNESAMGAGTCLDVTVAEGTRVLVFTRTVGFRHGSIASGVAAIEGLGARYGFDVTHTEDPSVFEDDQVGEFAVVVFLNTTGTVLDPDQKAAFQGYIQGGGGFAGVHAAADTEHEWPWYRELVGAYFRRHPPTQPATVRVTETSHPSTRCVPSVWDRVDEWYDYFEPPAPEVTILATLDPNSYQGGEMGDVQPIAWYHHFDGGRAWYTGLGHTDESFTEPEFLYHLAGGILWAAEALP